MVGLDARDGKVATDGWSKMTGHDVVDLAKKFEDYGVEAIIYTDIGRDGMLTGVNIEATVKLAQRDQGAGHRLRRPVDHRGHQSDLREARARRHRSARSPAARSTKARSISRKRSGRAPTRRPKPAAVGPPIADDGPRQAHHSLPRRRRRPRRQGRQLRQPARRRRSGRGRARATTSRAPTSSRSSTSARASRQRGLLLRHDRGGGVAGVHSADRRRRRATVEDIRALLNAGADKVSINTAGVQQPGARRRSVGALRRAMHRRRRSTPRSARSTSGRSTSTAAARRPGIDAVEWARRSGRARRRRDPAHQHGPRRRAHGLRPRAHARGRRAVDVPVIASGGVGTLERPRRRHQGRRRRRGARREHLPLRRVHDRGRPRRRWRAAGIEVSD